MAHEADDAAASFVSRVMAYGWTEPAATTDVGDPASAAAARGYELLFMGDFAAALAVVREPENPTPYLTAVRRQVEALCAGYVSSGLSTAEFPLDTISGAMAVFHTAEAAHVAGELVRCDEILTDALAAGVAHQQPRLWIRLALVRLMLYAGDLARAERELALAEEDAQFPVGERSVQAMHAQLAGFKGDPAPVIALAEALRLAITAPRTYADSGILLSASLGLAACGLPQAASELLRYGAGGPGLPLLPLSLRAYGYEVLVEAAVAAGNTELAAWILLDFDRLDLGGNPQMEAARETSRARVMIAAGQARAGAAHAWEATKATLATGSAFFGARAALTAALAGDGGAPVDHERVARLIETVTPVDLRSWMTRVLADAGRAARPLPGVGWDQLTPTQEVVARLAASGLRNHQIAELLVVSPRTVESHVAAILDTLGVSTRVGIVARDERAGAANQSLLEALTPRQREVALALVEGQTNGRIAERLGISEKAVERHVHRIFGRLGVTSRAAVAAALLHR